MLFTLLLYGQMIIYDLLRISQSKQLTTSKVCPGSNIYNNNKNNKNNIKYIILLYIIK